MKRNILRKESLQCRYIILGISLGISIIKILLSQFTLQLRISKNQPMTHEIGNTKSDFAILRVIENNC